MKTDASELRWVRIIDPAHIPVKYVEQIKDRCFSVEDFYKWQIAACSFVEDGLIKVDPTNLLFVLADKENLVKGFCWMVVDALCKALVIQSFSVDPEYWCSGVCVPILEKHAKAIKDGAKLDKVWWITRSPKHSEKYGFKRSKHVLMEYVGGDHGTDIHGLECETGGESGLDESGAEEIP